jgi:hypothetical protein
MIPVTLESVLAELQDLRADFAALRSQLWQAIPVLRRSVSDAEVKLTEQRFEEAAQAALHDMRDWKPLPSARGDRSA